MSLLLMWKQQLLMNNFKYFSLTGSGSLLLPGSIKGKFKELTLSGTSTQGENPAPDNPQEIKSAGRKSKNLLIENISVFTVQDNIAYITLPEGHETKLYTMLIQKKLNKNDDIGFSCGFYDKANMTANYSTPCLKDGNLVTTNGVVNSKVGVNHFVCFAPADSRFFDIYNVMYVEGKETALAYEPYGYLLDVKVTGKNLFNVEKAKDANNWTSSAILPSYKEFSIYVGKGNSVNISYLENLETGLGFYANIARSKNDYTMYWLYHSDSEINITKNKNFIAMNDYIVLRVDAGSVPKFFEYIKTLQIEIGSKQTPYQPYTEQTVQIALDEPLRGIGEYKDTITKDGVVRKIKRAVFDGSEDEKWGLSREHEKHINFALVIKDAITVNTGIRTMMDKFKYFGAIWNGDILGQDMFGAMLRINMPKTLATDLQTFKTWLSQNPLTVDYALAEPVTEPLPESVQALLQALHSENGTTHVIIDSGEVAAEISATYMRK